MPFANSASDNPGDVDTAGGDVSMAAVRWSTTWALDQVAPSADPSDPVPADAGRVLLSAGIDRLVEIDGLFDADIAMLHRWAAGETIDTSAAPRQIVDQLIGLGVLVSDVATPGDVASKIVVVIGEPVAESLAVAVVDRVDSFGQCDATLHGTAVACAADVAGVAGVADVAPTIVDADLIIALRSHERVKLDHGRDAPIMHVDLRHEHTLVVGPVELPGVSACDTCYDTRLARRWRLPTLPERPAVLDSQEFVAELVAFHAARFAADGSHLVNATIAHSLRDGTANRDALLRVPGCPGCGRQRSATGRVRLPWTS